MLVVLFYFLPVFLILLSARLTHRFLHLALRILLLLDGSVQELFSIIFAHLVLIVLILLIVLVLVVLIFIVLVLVFILILVLILILLVFVLVFILIVLILIVLLVLLLVFKQFLAEGKIISGCIVLRIAAQGVLITSYGLRILLMLLHDHTHVVVTSGASNLVRFQFRSILKLYHRHRILLLHHQGAPQIIDSLRILLILGDSLAILRFGCSPLLFMIGAVSLADEVAVILRSHLRQAQHHQGKNQYIS